LKSNPMTLPDSTSAISSPGSADGRSPCDGQDSKALPESGPAPVRVSRFRALASERGKQTSATFGPLFTRSSPSGDLQRCLESRLRARMDVNGSPEFALTWKDWDMPAGVPICALRASERRTGDKGCSGWPTPMAGTKATEDYNEAGNTDSGRRTVELCGWPTCSARDWKDSEGMATEGTNPDGSTRKRLDMLPRVAQLAAWPTPNTMEGGQTRRGGKRKGEALMGGLVGWATPRAEDAESAGMRHSRGVADTLTAQAGQGATSCPAGTGKRGVLRPGHSRWLMGFPAAWDSCGATAMQSCRKSRRSS
jgi:hypothetical protein